MAPTSHIWCPTSSKILTETRQTCQKEPKDPSRSRFSLILDPSGPRFPMILDTFWMYFKCCFEHCVRTLRSSFDCSGERFSFFLVPLPSHFLHLLYMFRKALCMFCACSFDLFRNRLDLELVLRRSIGEACSIRRSTFSVLLSRDKTRVSNLRVQLWDL